jgi:predicted ATPase with chaperone activity
MSTLSSVGPGSLLASILEEESFRPAQPRSMEETGLSPTLIEDLIVKYLLNVGSESGRKISDKIGLPFGILEPLFSALRSRQLLVHTGSAPLNDYYFALTDQGRNRAQQAMKTCAYVGSAPVLLEDYICSVEAQTLRAESPQREELEEAFSDICVEPTLFDQLGPAINSGAGLFLYGAPGNGKTTLATRMTACFGQDIWIPRTLTDDGQIIKLYDASVHEAVRGSEGSILKDTDFDQRWIRIVRPTVVVGGELTLDALEMKHDDSSHLSEAPIQLKSNCGCLLIDDFGRQRVEPQALLNRWIVPLENKHDFLTLASGKKIQVPFEQLIIFSTNLEPADLTDDAFLRRIPYKIEVGDPERDEFHLLFEVFSRKMGCDYDPSAVDYLINTHYVPNNRPLRRCQPRDLLTQIRNHCTYHDIPLEMKPEYFDLVVKSYFTVVAGN